LKQIKITVIAVVSKTYRILISLSSYPPLRPKAADLQEAGYINANRFYYRVLASFHAAMFRFPIIIRCPGNTGLAADVFYCSSRLHHLDNGQDLVLGKMGFAQSDLLVGIFIMPADL